MARSTGTKPAAWIAPGGPLTVLSVRPSAPLVALLVASAVWVTGCGESEAPGSALVAASAAADGADAADAAAFAAAYVPALEQVQGRIQLRAEQVAAVSAALEELRSRPARTGDVGRRGPTSGERPCWRFIERCADVLDPDQLAALITMLTEGRERLRQEREQVCQEREQVCQERERLRQEREQVRRDHGQRASRTARDGGRREALREARREQRKVRRAQMEARVIALLTTALHLEAAQVEAVTRILAEAHDRAAAVRGAARGGQGTPDDARAQLEQIREESRAAIAALLTEEQQAVFAALLPWLPRPPRGGPRRG